MKIYRDEKNSGIENMRFIFPKLFFVQFVIFDTY